jgi:hypothetical protein
MAPACRMGVSTHCEAVSAGAWWQEHKPGQAHERTGSLCPWSNVMSMPLTVPPSWTLADRKRRTTVVLGYDRSRATRRQADRRLRDQRS